MKAGLLCGACFDTVLGVCSCAQRDSMGAKEVLRSLSGRALQGRNGDFIGMVHGLSHRDLELVRCDRRP